MAALAKENFSKPQNNLTDSSKSVVQSGVLRKKRSHFSPLFVTFLGMKSAEVRSLCFPPPGRRPGSAHSFHTGGDNEVYTPAKTNHQHVLAPRQHFVLKVKRRVLAPDCLFVFFEKKKKKAWQRESIIKKRVKEKVSMTLEMGPSVDSNNSLVVFFFFLLQCCCCCRLLKKCIQKKYAKCLVRRRKRKRRAKCVCELDLDMNGGKKE